MAKEVDSNSYELIRDNPLSAEGVYMYSGKMIGYPDLEEGKLYPVYRPAEELEKAAETFNGVPFIIDHEMLGKGGTPYDRRPANGVLMNVKYKAGKLFGDLKIWSEAMKNKILNGVKELSLGYKSVYERSRGVFNGQRYDFIQRNLRGNHLALVKNGRMGSEMRVYDFREANTFDSVEFDINNKEKEVIMEKDKEQKEVEKKTSDEFVSAEKLYAKFPEHKEWIDANKYTRSEDEEPKKDEEEKSKASEKDDAEEEKKKDTEDKIVVKKDKYSKTGFTTKKVEDEKVDKRKLIDQIGGILKSKDLDDEIIRTIIGKAEEIAYNGSEKSEADDKEEKKEEVKEEKKEEVKEEETKDGCGMDADEIRKQAKEEAIKTIRAMDDFASKVFPHCGKFTYDSMESVEQMAEEACKKLNLETNGNAVATINGFISAKSAHKVVFTLDANEQHKSVNLEDEVKSRLNKIFSK